MLRTAELRTVDGKPSFLRAPREGNSGSRPPSRSPDAREVPLSATAPAPRSPRLGASRAPTKDSLLAAPGSNERQVNGMSIIAGGPQERHTHSGAAGPIERHTHSGAMEWQTSGGSTMAPLSSERSHAGTTANAAERPLKSGNLLRVPGASAAMSSSSDASTKASDAVSKASASTSPSELAARKIRFVAENEKIEHFYDFGVILGQGGYGTVAKITHAKTFQTFAGKVLDKRTLAEVDDAEECFRKVMGVMLNHEHPNIVKTVNVFEDKLHYYVVMDICPGGTLRELVREKGRLPHTVVENVVNQILGGLEHLHTHQLLHRDISCNNVMLTTALSDEDAVASGEKMISVQLVDFDLCVFFDETSQVRSSVVEGTLGYMAPEIMRKKTWSPCSDLYALGGVIYYMLRLESPCSHIPDEELDTMTDFQILAAIDEWQRRVQAICNKEHADVPVSYEPPAEEHHSEGSTTNVAAVALSMLASGNPAAAKEFAKDMLQQDKQPHQPRVGTPHGTPQSARGERRSRTYAVGAAIVTGSGVSLSAREPTVDAAGFPNRSGRNDWSRQSSDFEDRERVSLKAEVAISLPLKARLWRLAAWCVDRDYSRRPKSVQIVFSSGLVRPDLHIPNLTNSPARGQRKTVSVNVMASEQAADNSRSTSRVPSRVPSRAPSRNPTRQHTQRGSEDSNANGVHRHAVLASRSNDSRKPTTTSIATLLKLK